MIESLSAALARDRWKPGAISRGPRRVDLWETVEERACPVRPPQPTASRATNGRWCPGRTDLWLNEVPGNWHRALDTRRALRDEVLKRPGDNPIHQIAAAVATLGEAVEAFADFARRQGWPEWTAELADIFASAANSATEWLLKLAGKLDDWRPGWSEMPKWRP